MTTGIFFKSTEHQQRFVIAIQRTGKISCGTFDPEYSAALYILTADLSTWQSAQGYILQKRGIDFEGMLEEVDFSGGYSVLIKVASNLFNGNTHIDPVELLRLDEMNFNVAMTALLMRRYGFKAEELVR